MSNNWNIEADYAEYIEPDYSSFGNEKFPSHCQLRVRGGIKIDKKSLRRQSTSMRYRRHRKARFYHGCRTHMSYPTQRPAAPQSSCQN